MKLVVFPNGVIEAGICAEVACGTFLFNYYRKCILVAVGGDAYNLLHVAACLTLAPELLTRARPEAGALFFNAYFKAFSVHISNGKHLFALCVNHNSRDKSFFVKFQFIKIHFL